MKKVHVSLQASHQNNVFCGLNRTKSNLQLKKYYRLKQVAWSGRCLLAANGGRRTLKNSVVAGRATIVFSWGLLTLC
jgi:hypothetical protein